MDGPHAYGAVTRRTFLLVGGALVVPAVAHLHAQPNPAKPMRIGIIGSGRQGGAIGLQWARAGHQILFSSRNPESLQDLVARAGSGAVAGTPAQAATFGDVVLIAVPYGALPQVGRDYAHLLKGKVVIDVEHLPGVRLVRALNALSFTQVTKEAHRPGEKLGIPIASDDAEAIAITEQLVRDAGFDPVVVGGLARAREFDAGTPVYVKGLTAAQLKAALKLP
jgi:predicted dinucleotide-binding enzyme